MKRVYNFNKGPAALPLKCRCPGGAAGFWRNWMSVMELSHRRENMMPSKNRRNSSPAPGNLTISMSCLFRSGQPAVFPWCL